MNKLSELVGLLIAILIGGMGIISSGFLLFLYITEDVSSIFPRKNESELKKPNNSPLIFKNCSIYMPQIHSDSADWMIKSLSGDIFKYPLFTYNELILRNNPIFISNLCSSPDGQVTVTRHLGEDDDRLKQINYGRSAKLINKYDSFVYPNDYTRGIIPFEVKLPNGKTVWIDNITEYDLVVSENGRKMAKLIAKAPSVSLTKLYSEASLYSEGEEKGRAGDLEWEIYQALKPKRGDPKCYQIAMIINRGPGTIIIEPNVIVVRESTWHYDISSHYPIILFPGDRINPHVGLNYKATIDPFNRITEINKGNNYSEMSITCVSFSDPHANELY